jgi:chromosome transmission fidelity protein 18
LSTLQFFKSRGLKLTSYDVHKSFVGSKDETKSHFSVWQELFQMPRPTKRKYVNLAKDNEVEQEENCAALDVRFKNILRSVMANGDYEKLQQGIFENYLEIKFKDSRLQNVVRGQEHLLFYDVVQQQIMHSQNYRYEKSIFSRV